MGSAATWLQTRRAQNLLDGGVMPLYFLLLCLLLCLPLPTLQASALGERDLKPLSDKSLQRLVEHPDPVRNIDPSNPSSHLSKILIPRPPDTQNNTIVREYIVQTMKRLKWHVEEDSFTDKTPYGEKRFTNIIATKDPKASRRVILAAHFDSKYFSSYPQNQFVGATDSAAPCAFMLDLAETLDPMLEKRLWKLRRRDDDEEDDDDGDEDDELGDLTIQLVFFDGEEAFKDWTPTDSIYGARHLARKWASTYITPNTKRRLVPSAYTTELSTIEHFILLDLLGAPHPLIRSSFIDTAWLFDAMLCVEGRLADSGAFVYDGDKVTTKEKWTSFFIPRTLDALGYGGYGIGDDHTPFLERGVSVLHVIANPFPRVWHTIGDDASALDIPTMRRWNLILRAFICEYLGLNPDEEDRRASIHRSTTELHGDDL